MNWKNNLLFTIASIVALSGVAFAQEDTNPSDDDVIGVYQRGRPDYMPNGIKAGSFKIHTGGSVNYLHNNNVFADENNAVSDSIMVYSPKISAESDWNRHKMQLTVDGNIGRYSDNSDENYNDVNAKLDTTLDVLKGHAIDASVYTAKKHEDRASPDDVLGVKPTKFIQSGGSVWYTKNAGKISLKVLGGMDNFKYNDTVKVSPNSATPPVLTASLIDNGLRDRNEYNARTRVGYEFMPNYEAFVEGGYKWVRYDRIDFSAVPVFGASTRDSEGYDLVAGTAVNLTGKLKGEVYAGYQAEEYDDNVLSDISGGKFGGAMLWNVTPITSAKVGVEQSIMETAVSTASGYLSTNANMRLEHELRRNILIAADGAAINNSFKSVGTSDREDDLLNGGLEAVYLINHGLSLTGRYDIKEQDSNVAGEDYSIQQFMVKLGAEL